MPLPFNSYLMGPATIHNFKGMQISLKSATEFKMFVLDNKDDVIWIQETHLKPRRLTMLAEGID